ncbi:MAG TPA: SDR family NAD(P)-dependent oxidoreductase [Dongiaceae bacterium]|jgi:NAD(P)-dependent dehydrogenase (short-subunit alcohol dehydrogenase family)|nr:SDR family NAD(P)-dependent oxidoreductase [Dongiaceae bacterium]
MRRFEGRVAVVSGAAQGMGKAVADRLGQEGALVVAVDINRDGANATAKAIGGKSFGIVCDIGDEDAVGKLFETVASECGKLDVLVNNAAIVPFVKWDEIDFKEWRRVLRVNLDGLFLMCRAGSNLMRKNNYGRIVNFSSNSIFAGTPNMAHYVASKGGVLTFTRALATELGGYKITVNSVCPGLIDTEGVQASPHKEAFGFVEMLQAIKGKGMPTDVAPAVAFLASEEAHWITGQALTVDAGMVRW